MSFLGLDQLASEWRSEAELFRRRGLDEAARMAESYAAELEVRVLHWSKEALTLSQAEKESGYSRSALERRLATGEIQNAGEFGAPRILRRDLPRKGGSSPSQSELDEPDIARIVLGNRR